jgi:hypothetical protein
MSTPHSCREQRTVGSMLWAAWADALGFISELTDDAGLLRRLRGKPLTEPVQWTRRVGGQFGADMTLRPAATATTRSCVSPRPAPCTARASTSRHSPGSSWPYGPPTPFIATVRGALRKRT